MSSSEPQSDSRQSFIVQHTAGKTESVSDLYHDALYGGDKKSRGINMALTLILDLGLGIGGFYLAKYLGFSNVVAYFIAALGPFLSLIINLIRSKVVSIFSIGIIAFQLLGIALTFFVGKHEKWLLYKDGILSIFLSGIMLISLIVFRPVFFYIFQRFNSDGTKDGYHRWDRLWDYAHIRKAIRLITLMWGVIILAEGILKIITTSQFSFGSSYVINTVAPLIILVIGSIIMGNILEKVKQECVTIDNAQS